MRHGARNTGNNRQKSDKANVSEERERGGGRGGGQQPSRLIGNDRRSSLSSAPATGLSPSRPAQQKDKRFRPGRSKFFDLLVFGAIRKYARGIAKHAVCGRMNKTPAPAGQAPASKCKFARAQKRSRETRD